LDDAARSGIRVGRPLAGVRVQLDLQALGVPHAVTCEFLALGKEPQTLPLSQGTVDGLTTSISSYHARKWFEGAPNITTSRFGLIAAVIIMHRELWNSLPANTKTMLAQASQTAAAYSTQTVLQEESEIIEKVRKSGVKVTQFSAAARTEFAKRTQPMYEEFYRGTGNSGRDLVQYVRSLK